MRALNCWEIKKCGREPGGIKTVELGVCPAAIDVVSNGVNNGKNGGRICWKVTGTLCGGKVQGTYAQKALSCLNCEFFKQVQKEEGTGFVLNPDRATAQ
ncbi:MAG: hypothetical protein D6800_12965 [Candidatus Zixiibacteriota bacterium]|nr:MAG: hypothetical protein D6800_12965 [candidate division Zixibacteria bacterium]